MDAPNVHSDTSTDSLAPSPESDSSNPFVSHSVFADYNSSDYSEPETTVGCVNDAINYSVERKKRNFMKYGYGNNVPYLYDSTDYFSTDVTDDDMPNRTRLLQRHLKKRRSYTRRLKFNVATEPETDRPLNENELEENQVLLYNISQINDYFRLRKDLHARSEGGNTLYADPVTHDLYEDSESSGDEFIFNYGESRFHKDKQWIEDIDALIQDKEVERPRQNPGELLPDFWPPDGLTRYYRGEKIRNFFEDSNSDSELEEFFTPDHSVEGVDYRHERQSIRFQRSGDGSIIVTDRGIPWFPELEPKRDPQYRPHEVEVYRNEESILPDNFSDDDWSDAEEQVQPSASSRHTDPTFEERFEYGEGTMLLQIPQYATPRERVEFHARRLRRTMHKTLYCSVCNFIFHQEVTVDGEYLIKRQPDTKFWCFRCQKAQKPLRVSTQCERAITNVPCRDCFSFTVSGVGEFEYHLYTDMRIENLQMTITRNMYDHYFTANHQFSHSDLPEMMKYFYYFIQLYHEHRDRVVRKSREIYDRFENEARAAIMNHDRPKARHYLCCLYWSRNIIKNISQKTVRFPSWFIKYLPLTHEEKCKVCYWTSMWSSFTDPHFEYLMRYYSPD